MIKAIIIEDELKVRKGLTKMINLLDASIEIIAETGLVKESVILLKELKPDLVFLDVELEDGTAFDILSQLTDFNFKVIFTTAYDKYAIDAFKYTTIDYLLKPINPVELKNAINRAVKTIKVDAEYAELLAILKENELKSNKKIVLNTSEERYVLKLNEIIKLKADGAYTVFYTSKEKIIVSKNLKFYEQLLDDSFIRCHQSHLVNSNHIKGINKDGHLELTNNQSAPISTRKKTEIKQFLADIN